MQAADQLELIDIDNVYIRNECRNMITVIVKVVVETMLYLKSCNFVEISAVANNDRIQD